MGVNVSIRNLAGDEHPTWDWIRHAGDRHMQRVLANTGCERVTLGGPIDTEELERPTDVDAFCDAMLAEHPENEARWQELRGILRDPQWWLYFSW